MELADDKRDWRDRDVRATDWCRLPSIEYGLVCDYTKVPNSSLLSISPRTSVCAVVYLPALALLRHAKHSFSLKFPAARGSNDKGEGSKNTTSPPEPEDNERWILLRETRSITTDGPIRDLGCLRPVLDPRAPAKVKF
jgi:hypothetical protein